MIETSERKKSQSSQSCTQDPISSGFNFIGARIQVTKLITNFFKPGTWIYKKPPSTSKESKYMNQLKWSKLKTAYKTGTLEGLTPHKAETSSQF